MTPGGGLDDLRWFQRRVDKSLPWFLDDSSSIETDAVGAIWGVGGWRSGKMDFESAP